MTKPTFTIIAPIYNELDNIPELYARIREVMDQTSQRLHGWVNGGDPQTGRDR